MATAAERLDALLKHPPIHRGLTELDRNSFVQTIDLLAVAVPASRVAEALKVLKRRPAISPFADDPSDSSLRLMLLLESDVKQLTESLRLKCAEEEWHIRPHRLVVPYEHWSASDILKSILPREMVDETPSSFARVGHIAHLNLRDEYLPYRHTIGAVILDKNPGIRTVVNKLDTIDNEFRFFRMEVLAGEQDFVAEVHEQDCRFQFDFSKVYWNTRLSTEHGRLVDILQPGEVVVDAFAGVGPFALPAAKKGCSVLANDLNPASADSLRTNIRLNKLIDRVRPSEEDARIFIRRSVVELYEHPFPAYRQPLSSAQKKEAARVKRAGGIWMTEEPAGPPLRFVDHFIMNLPATALEFLDAYRGLYIDLVERHEGFEAAMQARPLPMVHCYCFTTGTTPEAAEEDICRRGSTSLGYSVSRDLDSFSLSYVRSVAPHKTMYRLSFRLPWAVLILTGANAGPQKV